MLSVRRDWKIHPASRAAPPHRAPPATRLPQTFVFVFGGGYKVKAVLKKQVSQHPSFDAFPDPTEALRNSFKGKLTSRPPEGNAGDERFREAQLLSRLAQLEVGTRRLTHCRDIGYRLASIEAKLARGVCAGR